MAKPSTTASTQLSTRQAARRQRLLDAALELLESRDYERISVREVAESASVALATLYHYFPSKEHLFGEALVQWASTLSSDVTRRPLRGTTPAARLEEALLRSVRAFERRPQLAHLIGLFELSDEDLAARGAVRRIADARSPGYPCRVSLTDSRPGDELILVNYEHHAVASPYRMRFAVFVRRGEETYDAVDRVPDQLRCRTLAARAFDSEAMLIGSELVEGRDLEGAVERLLADPRAAYLHLHFAAPGCYAARVERV